MFAQTRICKLKCCHCAASIHHVRVPLLCCLRHCERMLLFQCHCFYTDFNHTGLMKVTTVQVHYYVQPYNVLLLKQIFRYFGRGCAITKNWCTRHLSDSDRAAHPSSFCCFPVAQCNVFLIGLAEMLFWRHDDRGVIVSIGIGSNVWSVVKYKSYAVQLYRHSARLCRA
jgi:hypothetical protein